MNFLISKNWAQINAIKKQCVVQKFNRIFSANPFVLFFHYNGSKIYNWELLKKKISQKGVDCKGLFVPSNLHSIISQHPPSRKGQGLHMPSSARKGETAHLLWNRTLKNGGWRFLIKGPTLAIGCSSAKEMETIFESCTSPTFYCIGGLHKNNVLTHLDVKRWLFLHQFGESGLHSALLSLLWHQKKKIFGLTHPLTIHSLLHCNLIPLFLLLEQNKLKKSLTAIGEGG